MRLLFALLLIFLPTLAQADVLRMAVTTSFHNSGLAERLLPAIEADTGIEVQLLVVGTGQALRLGRAGDVDALLVHARQAEEAFVASGFATHRREIMYNDFVIVGPKADPARIVGAPTAARALGRIADGQSAFVSRGDDSGTHQKELGLWRSDDRDALQFGPWYRAVGAGMGAALNTAAALDGYVLTDRASWMNFANKAGLTLLFEGDPALHNPYAYLPVSPEKHPHVKEGLTARLEAWLTSEPGRAHITGLRLDGVQLFHIPMP